MKYKTLLKFHMDTLAEYNTFWRSETKRSKAEVTLQETAYQILLHSGMLYRYTGYKNFIEDIPDSKILIKNAMEYISGTTIVKDTQAIVNSKKISGFDLFDIEILFEMRDEIETVKQVITTITHKLKDTTITLTKIKAITNQFDSLVKSNNVVIKTGIRYINTMKPHIKIELNKTNYWWFFTD